MGFDYSKLEKIKKNDLYEDVYYYKKNEEMKKEQERARKEKESIKEYRKYNTQERIKQETIDRAISNTDLLGQLMSKKSNEVESENKSSTLTSIYQNNNLEGKEQNLNRYKTITSANDDELNNSLPGNKRKANSTEKKDNIMNLFKSSEVFEDGWQPGDVLKTIGATAGDIGYNIIKGGQNLSEGIADKISYGIANYAENQANRLRTNRIGSTKLANDYATFANNLRGVTKSNVWQETTQPFADYIDKNSVSGEMLDSAMQGVGQSTIQAGMAMLPGGQVLMPTTTYLSSSGNATTQALLEGATQEEAEMYGRIAGLGETLTEYLAGGITNIGGKLGISKGIGELDDKLAKLLTKKINSQLAKNLVQMGVKASGEGVEEVISGAISALGKKLTYKSEEDLKKLIQDENLLNSFIVGTLSAGISQGPGAITATINGVDYVNLPTAEDIKVQQKLQEAQDIINNVQNQQGQANNTTNTQTQQIMQEENKVSKNGLSEKIPISRTTRNTAEKYANRFTSREVMNNTVSSLEKIAEIRNQNNKGHLDILFDDKVKGNGIIEINGDNRIIRLNPSSNKAVEFTLIHELSHDLKGTKGYDNLVKLVEEYNDGNISYQDAFDDIKDMYESYYRENGLDLSKLDVKEEAVNDILGTALGTQEFVNRITQEHRGIAQKLYDWVKKQITIYKSENKELTRWLYKVQDNFENALKQQNKLEDGFKLSKEITSDGIRYIKSDNSFLQDSNGNDRTLKEAYRSLISQDYKLDDGAEIAIVEELPKITDLEAKGKGMYNEIVKRQPSIVNKGVKDIKALNQAVNANLKETIEQSKYKNTKDDVNNRHLDYGIISFDTRTVNYYDTNTNRAYKIEYSIANKTDGTQVLYAKKSFKYDKELTEKINKEIVMSRASKKGSSQSLSLSNNSIPPSNENVNTTKYSIQESENNTDSFSIDKTKHSIDENQTERISKLNNDFDLTYKTREELYEQRDKLQKQYDELTKSQEYIEAYKRLVKMTDMNKVESSQEYEFVKKAQNLKNKINDIQDEIDIATSEMRRLSDAIKQEENQHRTPEEAIKQAKKTLGLTDNFNEAGYMLQDGSLLDFSGRSQGSNAYNQRTIDHREINEFGYDMNEFIDLGNIRLQPESNGFELMKEPTEQQYNKLKEYINKSNGEVFIDIYKNGKMGLYDTADYKSGTPTNKIISDLQYYFKNGKFPAKSQFSDFLYSQTKEGNWNNYLDKLDTDLSKDNKRTKTNFVLPTPNKTMKDNVLPTASQNVKNNVAESARPEQNKANEQSNTTTAKNNYTETREYTKKTYNNKKTNYTQAIPNFTKEDANTTPELKQRQYEKGEKQSSFFRNVVQDSKFINKDLREQMAKEENIRYYKGITNEETLEKAYKDLQEGGKNETLKWFNKGSNNISAEDVAKGWILLKQYQDKGDYQGAVEVAKKMRSMATRIGQAEQAYNILSRLTPEGMFYYAQSELNEVYERMAEGKTKEWIENNQSKFDLTQEETQFIKEKMESIQGTEDERAKKVALAEIQKIIVNKIPPTASQRVKAWMRISMLFNPKTQIRNILGNTVILPVNISSDIIAMGIDKVIAKKTGVRTTGITKSSLKNYVKGFGKGLYESYDDFRKGINTRNIQGNRFEVTEGKNFKDKGIGKALNALDNMLTFALDAGDRGFYEATFVNSINNQLVLNNTKEVTQDMIDIATKEALQRTWQDDNAYTQTVLTIRNALNGKVGKHKGMGYGLGDVLIPFAKTPANLTKAIVDYSPVGLTKTLAIDARKLKNSLDNGQYSPQLQHKFVQDLGKGMAGSFLYILGYALAKVGIATGEADDDKDVKNFMKNSLGISSYSIKIGDKTFTYDWAQPVATPLAIMTNYVKYSKDNPDANVLERIWKSMNIGTEQLLEQSFMQTLNTVLNGNGTTLENLSQSLLELPARAIPTLSKQIADMIDPTQRTTFEYGKPIQSSINYTISKIPFLSKTLPASVDTLGNEIQKYGGNNNLWNVMLNPANTNKGQLSKAGEEIYNIYMQTGDTTIFPRTAPYYINSKGEKLTMTAEERNQFQKITGQYVESCLNSLLTNKDYKKLSDEKKAELINNIVSDSYAKAKYDVLKIDSKEYKNLRDTLKNVSTSSYYDYKFKTEDMKKDKEKIEVLVNANYTDKEKQTIYENYIKSEKDEKYDIIKSTGLSANNYLKYKLADSNEEFASDKKDNGTVKGKTITNSAKNKRYNYIINMKGATYTQKLILFALEYEPSSNTDKQQVINYVLTLKGKTKKEKLDILSKFKGVTIYKDGTFDY